MAVDFNSVKMLLWAKNLGAAFDRTLTLGHLGFPCPPRLLRRALRDFGLAATTQQIARCLQRVPCRALYSDEFLRFLGARELVSVDRSDFEGANRLHDLNEPFPEADRASYDMVLDGGTLEHIFNFPAALRHCLELLRPGGHFLTLTPANNQMGHGFYQFSPELFFRVFSAENGFAVRKLVVFEATKTDADFFQVNDPATTGLRTDICSSRPLYLAVLAQRIAVKPILAKPPQQSDYAAAWERHRQAADSPAAAPTGLLWRMRTALNLYVPYWLRNWKTARASSRQRGPANLSNRRLFHRLSAQDIFRERAGPVTG